MLVNLLMRKTHFMFLWIFQCLKLKDEHSIQFLVIKSMHKASQKIIAFQNQLVYSKSNHMIETTLPSICIAVCLTRVVC